MQTIYRIVNADGTEIGRGRRTRVAERIGTRRLIAQLDCLTIERGKFYPDLEAEPPVWKHFCTGMQFVSLPRRRLHPSTANLERRAGELLAPTMPP